MRRKPRISSGGLFIQELNQRPRRAAWSRLLRWCSVGVLPLVGTCAPNLNDLLCRLGSTFGLLDGCATTLAVGEEG